MPHYQYEDRSNRSSQRKEKKVENPESMLKYHQSMVVAPIARSSRRSTLRDHTQSIPQTLEQDYQAGDNSVPWEYHGASRFGDQSFGTKDESTIVPNEQPTVSQSNLADLLPLTLAAGSIETPMFNARTPAERDTLEQKNGKLS